MFEFIGMLVLFGLAIFGIGALYITFTSPKEPFPWEDEWDRLERKKNRRPKNSPISDDYDSLVASMNAPALVDLTPKDKVVSIPMGVCDTVVIPVNYVKRTVSLYGLAVPINEYFLDPLTTVKIGGQTFNGLSVHKKSIAPLWMKSSRVDDQGNLRQNWVQRVTMDVVTYKHTANSCFKYTGKFTYLRDIRVVFKGRVQRDSAVDSITSICSYK